MSVHTRQAPPQVTLWPGDTLDGAITLDNDVIGLDAEGRVEGGYTWTLTLLPRQGVNGPGDLRRVSTLYRTIRANQVVAIGMERRGGILVGLVDSVHRTAQHGGQSAGVGIVVRGSGFQKVLQRDGITRATVNVGEYPQFRREIVAALGEDAPIVNDVPGAWGPETRDGVPSFIAQSVDDVIAWLLKHAPSMRLPLLAAAVGGDGRPADYFDTTRSVTTWHDARVWAESLADYQGSVWGFLQSILDRDLYECWVDSIPPATGTSIPTPTLVVRPKPYDDPQQEWAPVTEQTGLTWGELRTMITDEPWHTIPLDAVVAEALGTSDAQAYAVYVATARYELAGSPGDEARGLYYPLVDTFTASRFGIAKYSAELSLVGADVSRLAEGDADYTAEIAAEVVEARNRIFNWYRANPWYENGSVTVVGRDAYRPGDRVFLPWVELQLGNERGALFYVAGVRWSWRFGDHYLTTLTLTRGQSRSMLAELAALIAADAPPSNPKHYAAVGR